MASPVQSTPIEISPVQEIIEIKSTPDSNHQNGNNKGDTYRGENGSNSPKSVLPTSTQNSTIASSNNNQSQAVQTSIEVNNTPGDVNDQVKQILEGEDEERKRCLLCFAVFPEDAVVKKRVLLYWWIGEGLPDYATAKQKSDEILEEFLEKDFIRPVHKKRRDRVLKNFKMNGYQMNPVVHSAVTTHAKQKGLFYLNPEGKLISKHLSFNRACLLDDKERSSIPAPTNDSNPDSNQNQVEKLKTLFNISEKCPGFTPESFSKMKGISVLCLGRWQHTSGVDPEDHIEVESAEFLKGLKNMKRLRLLSLHGVSRIERLPRSISNLRKLTVLDLRACYNLEELPSAIGSLTMLTHLDLSECYLLERMPKALTKLKELQVFKGFVISDAPGGNLCSLDELANAKLEKLRKLSININSESYDIETLSPTLKQFTALLKLKVAWGAGSSKTKPDDKNSTQQEAKSSKDTKKGKKGLKELITKRTRSAAQQNQSPQKKSKEDNKKKEKDTAKSEATNKANKPDESARAKSEAAKEVNEEDNKKKEKDTVKSEATNQANKPDESAGAKSEAPKEVNKEDNKKKEKDTAKSEATNQANKPDESAGAKSEATNQANKGNYKKEKSSAAKKKVTIQEKSRDEEKEKDGGETAKQNQLLQQKHSANRPAAAATMTKSLSSLISFKQKRDDTPPGSKLEKLDLQCFPLEALPVWLIPEDFTRLKKLYIRGGGLKNLGEVQEGKEKWKVEVLRLKHLYDLKMDWRELRPLFPDLKYLEKFKCPKITFCPCDDSGVWLSSPTNQSNQ